LCVTSSLATFSAISFIVSVTTVTPQLMLPLVGELAPQNRRAAALGIVVSGLTFGILIARVLSGTVTNFISWRYIYWISCGLQYLIFVLLWLFMPDYPSSNPGGLNYFKMLYDVFRMYTEYGVLVQACLLAYLTSATFTSFWTTLTALLSGPPYYYKPLPIGLFGLIGIGGMVCAPLYARLVTDRFVPLFSAIMGEIMCLVGIVVGTYIGTFNVGGPVIQAFLLDLGMQTAAIANRSAIYSVAPNARYAAASDRLRSNNADAKPGRNRINTAFMLATFTGQLTGTAAGNHIYARGGWIASGSTSVGFICATLLICAARGPWEDGWVGWHGGWSIKKKDKTTADGRTPEAVLHVRDHSDTSDIEKGAHEGAATEKTPDEVAADERTGSQSLDLEGTGSRIESERSSIFDRMDGSPIESLKEKI
jgi:predicted MFS family arabinose efflux permease